MYLLISTEKNSHFSLALGKEKLKKTKTIKKPYHQSELLLKEIDKLLKGKINKLKALMVVQGPGEFSALRIGVVTANALADSLNIPVCALKLEKNKEFLSEKEKLKNLFNQGVEQLAQGQTNDLVKPFYGVEPNIG